MNKTPFEDFDFSSFWDNNEYVQKYYVGATPILYCVDKAM